MHIWIIDSTYSKKLFKSGGITSTGVVIQDSQDCNQVGAIDDIIQHVKVTFYYILVQYRDGITNKVYFQSYCFVWDRNDGLVHTLPNSSNQDDILWGIAKDWQKGKVEDFLISEEPIMKDAILFSQE